MLVNDRITFGNVSFCFFMLAYCLARCPRSSTPLVPHFHQTLSGIHTPTQIYLPVSHKFSQCSGNADTVRRVSDVSFHQCDEEGRVQV